MRTPALPETDPRLPRPVALALYGVGYGVGLAASYAVSHAVTIIVYTLHKKGRKHEQEV